MTLLSSFSKTFAFSVSSLQKLECSRRVRSATDGGFSGNVGPGPRDGSGCGSGK